MPSAVVWTGFREPPLIDPDDLAPVNLPHGCPWRRHTNSTAKRFSLFCLQEIASGTGAKAVLPAREEPANQRPAKASAQNAQSAPTLAVHLSQLLKFLDKAVNIGELRRYTDANLT